MNNPDYITFGQCMLWAGECAQRRNARGHKFWHALAKKVISGARITLDDLPKPEPIHIGDI